MSFEEKKQKTISIQHVRIFNAIAIYLTNKQHQQINKDWDARTEELQSSRVLGSKELEMTLMNQIMNGYERCISDLYIL